VSGWFLPEMFALVGVGQIVMGVRMAGRTRRRRAVVARCLPGRAVVTGVTTRSMTINRKTQQLPVVAVRYLDARGVRYDSTLAVSRTWERYAPGQEIAVIYDPERPSTVLTRGNDTLLSGAGCLFISAGTVFTLISAAIVVVGLLLG
jgi:hypothetical protein